MAIVDRITSDEGADEGAYKAARKEIEERYRTGATLASLEEFAEYLPLPREERDALKLLALSICSEPMPRYQVRHTPHGHWIRPMRAALYAGWDDD